MGCDIHMSFEVKTKGKWRRVKLPQLDCDRRVDGSHESRCWVCDGTGKSDAAYQKADYARFAILAGVRNNITPPYVPISKPRGVPEDASLHVQKDYREWGETFGLVHSASWLTVREVVGYDWERARRPLGHTWSKELSTALVDEATKHGVSLDDARIVFWFDN